MSLELSAFLILLAISVAVPTILFLLLRSSLNDLLRHTSDYRLGSPSTCVPSFWFFILQPCRPRSGPPSI